MILVDSSFPYMRPLRAEAGGRSLLLDCFTSVSNQKAMVFRWGCGEKDSEKKAEGLF
jgi:hypothetical protein